MVVASLIVAPIFLTALSFLLVPAIFAVASLAAVVATLGALSAVVHSPAVIVVTAPRSLASPIVVWPAHSAVVATW
jgi:hypothetical protein